MTDAIVSVIVPCYNQAQYLDECLESVMAQTYTHWECIIVDDGSPDNTEQIAKSWCAKDSRYIYLHKSNGGLSSARNAGIKHSSGKYILPLDSDDIINKDYLQYAVEIFDKDGDIKLVYGRAELFGEENGLWMLNDYSYAKLLEGNMIYCAAIYKRVAYDKTLGYDEDLKTGFEDWDFWLQLLKENDKIHFIADISVFYYRIKNTSMLKEIDDERAKRLRLYIFRKHQFLYEKHWDDPIKLKREITTLYARYENSITYKVGVIITYPLKMIKNLLR